MHATGSAQTLGTDSTFTESCAHGYSRSSSTVRVLLGLERLRTLEPPSGRRRVLRLIAVWPGTPAAATGVYTDARGSVTCNSRHAISGDNPLISRRGGRGGPCTY